MDVFVSENASNFGRRIKVKAASLPAKKKRRKYLLRRKRTLDAGIVIDYKNFDVLKRFVTDRGKIIPRRISGATQEQQRKITNSVKIARYLALLPYTVNHETERGFAGEMQAVAQSATVFRGRTNNSNGRRFGQQAKPEAREQQEKQVNKESSNKD